MNVKWKVALLTLLGFSTAACCSTKKAAKSEEKTDDNITVEGEDPRIMLMYGVPFPDGRVAVPVDENGNPIAADENAELVVEPATDAKRGNVAFPDGREAAGITEEEAKKRIEEIKAAEAEANSEK